MDKRNKHWRRCHQWRLFKARMILRAACQDCMWDEVGHFIKRPHWFELAKQRWCQIYKTTGTPCSCWMCKGETYSRKDSKKEAQNIIKESLE